MFLAAFETAATSVIAVLASVTAVLAVGGSTWRAGSIWGIFALILSSTSRPFLFVKLYGIPGIFLWLLAAGLCGK